MPALAAILSNRPDSLSRVGTMLSAAKDPSVSIRTSQTGSHVLGVTADPLESDQAEIVSRGEWAAVFVGVLDNAGEFAPNSPAGIALDLIAEGGPSAIGRLRGAFSLVVSNGSIAWAARDHVGLEPLFYSHTKGELLIGSQVKQVLAASPRVAEPDLETVYSIFYGDGYDEARTAFLGVNRLSKGSYVEFTEGALRVVRFWDPRNLLESGSWTGPQIQERFDFLFSKAIERVLTGHDAISLSGGVDSSAIAAYGADLYRTMYGQRLAAISSIYPQQPSVDESALIEQLAASFDLELHTYAPSPLSLDRLQDWVRMFDGPWSAWHPGASERTYQQMRSLGYRSMLTGEFAEQVTDVNRGVLPHLIANKRIASALHVFQAQKLRSSPGTTRIRQAVSTFVPQRVMAKRRYRNPLAAIPPWMDSKRIRTWQSAATVAPRKAWRQGQIGFLDIATSSLEAYRILQAHYGVLVRYPFADVDFWEFWLSLPAEVKHPNARSKTLLRKLLRGRVPDAVLDAPKVVFNEYVTDRIDYPNLRKWLVEPATRIDGINYALLADRLDAEAMGMSEFMWAKDLAAVHAFLGLW